MKIRNRRPPTRIVGPTGASKVDPTRTGTIRRGVRREASARLAALRRSVAERIETILAPSYQTAPDQVQSFQGWFEGEVERLLLADDDWWLEALEAAYLKGAASAFDSERQDLRGDNKVAIRAEFLRRLQQRPVTNSDILAVNAFCPTGKGGGIDPTCSPGGTKTVTVVDDIPTKFGTLFQVGSKQFFFEAIKDTEGWHVGFGLQSKRGGDTSRMENDPNTSALRVLRGVQESFHAFIMAKQPDKVLFTGEKFDASRVKLYDRLTQELAKAYGYRAEILDFPALKEYVLVANDFCPTGKGGGIDPTCGRGGTKADRTRMLTTLKATGGFTFVASQGRYQLIGTEGYSVSPYPARSVIIDGKVTKGDIREFMQQNAELLGKPGHAVGAWKDPDSGKTFLDVVIVTGDKDHAIKLGREHDQIAIFSFKDGTTINTGGTGGVQNSDTAGQGRDGRGDRDGVEALEWLLTDNTEGCGAGAPGNPGFLPGNTCGSKGGARESYSMESGFHDMGRSWEMRVTRKEKHGDMEFDVYAGELRATKRDGVWRLMSIGVDEKTQRQGLATEMIQKAVEDLGAVQTSRVFSPKGRALFEKLVERGHADKIAEDDYRIHFGNRGQEGVHLVPQIPAKIKSSKGADIEVVQEPTKQQMVNWIKNAPNNQVKGISHAGKVIVFDAEDASEFDVYHEEVYETVSGRSAHELSGGDRFYAQMDNAGKVVVHTHRGHSQAHPALKEWAARYGIVVNARKPLRDVRGRFMSEKVNLLATRLENELRGATTAMSQQVARELIQGIESRSTPRQIARAITSKIDSIGLNRALTIVNTELVRAHAEGQLDAMSDLGVERVTPAVEWTTASNPCNLCAPLKGIVLTIDEARGTIPRHPNCRCSWVNARGPRPPGAGRRKLAKSSIDRAIVQSLREEGDVDFDDDGGWGAGATIRKKRPVVNDLIAFERATVNAKLEGMLASSCGAGVPGSPGFQPGNTCGAGGGHGYAGTEFIGDTPEVRNVLKIMLGDGAGLKDLADLTGAGALPDSPGRVRFSNPYTSAEGAYISIYVMVEGRDGTQIQRSFTRYPGTGKLVCHNQYFRVATEGKGLGTRVFAAQVEALREAGFSEIVTHAAGSKSNKDFNGYYTWPSLGYDCKLDLRKRKNVPEPFTQVRTVQELFSIPGGREWWKNNGRSKDLSFDLRDGSRSLQVLDAVLKAKGMR